MRICRKMRAVIVDDDMLFCEKFHKVLFSFFEQLGWIIEIDIINNVERIVNLEVVYDYYFVDIEMPSIMGFELIEKLRSRYVQAEFIIVSAYEKYMQKAFYLEPTAFIRKCELEADTKRTIQHLYRKMRGKRLFA